jgi:hypothetical protein
MFDVNIYRQHLVKARNEMQREYELSGPEPILNIALKMLEDLIVKIESGVSDWDTLELLYDGRVFFESSVKERSSDLFFQAYRYWKTKGEESEGL